MSIKTWQERQNGHDLGLANQGNMQAEIDDLRAALAERDAKLAALAEDVVTEEMKMAVRWAPSSAYWSTVLVNHFGPDARDGINSLEKQLREKIAAAGAAPVHDWLLSSTQELAKSIAKRCYPDVPQFRVLDDLAGVISQIDNMTTGMSRAAPVQLPVATVVDRDGVVTASLNSNLPIGTPLYANFIKGGDIPIGELAKWLANEISMLEAAPKEPTP